MPSRLRSKREVVDGAQGQTVDNRGDALGLAIGDDVCRLHQVALTQHADRTAVAIGAHDVELEALLVEPVARLARA